MCSEALGGVLGDGQAQAGTAGFTRVALVHPVEPFKDPCLMFLGDTDSGKMSDYIPTDEDLQVSLNKLPKL